MTRVVVWSERDEPGGGRLRDCAYAAYLMGLVFGGKLGYPLGAYAAAEREALEDADDRPDETGANLGNVDQAVGRRYGSRFVLVAGPDTLAAALTRVGTAVVVAGLNSRLPATHLLRRWQPRYLAGHAGLAIPIGGGLARFLDPLAPWRYDGDQLRVADLLRWAYHGAADRRVVKSDVFAPPRPPTSMHAAAGVYTTYAVIRGRARAIGTLPTRGFAATHKIIKAIQRDGTGTTTLMQILSGGYKGKIIYRFAPGITLR